MTMKWFKYVVKICPKLEVLTSHFSEVDDLFDGQGVKAVRHCAKRKYFNFTLCRI